jgi:hypothetical protein
MDPHNTPPQDKQITIDVPEDRVAEFYAFYGRFLAAEQFGRRGRRGGPRGPGHGRCGGRHGRHREHDDSQAEPVGGPPTTPSAPTGESPAA